MTKGYPFSETHEGEPLLVGSLAGVINIIQDRVDLFSV